MPPIRPEPPEQTRTLVSWKEIATFLNHAERTVKRWEQERDLPVHRIPGKERGSVFAYPAELSAWLLGEQGKAVQASSPGENDPVESPSSPRMEPPEPIASGATPLSGRRSTDHMGPRISMRSWVTWITPPALILGAAGGLYLASHLNRSAAAARHSETTTTSAHTPSPHAEELYLEGRYEWNLRTAQSLNKSIDDFTQAIVQDPAYALAYAGLAESYDLLPEYGDINRDEAFSRAKAASERAIALDPNLPAGHRAKAFALFYGDWDAQGSEREFKEALALAPNEVETHHWYATTLYSRREKEQALAQIDEALRLSPTSPAIQADAAFLHVSLGHNVEASIKTLRELARTQPNLVKASRYLYGIDFARRDYDAFRADLLHTVSIAHKADESELASAVERGWERGGEHGLLAAIRDVDLAQLARGDNKAFDVAGVYLRLGQPGTALHYFELALKQRDVRIARLPADSSLPALEEYPNYRALFQRIDEAMHLSPPPSLHLAVSTEPGKLPVASQ